MKKYPFFQLFEELRFFCPFRFFRKNEKTKNFFISKNMSDKRVIQENNGFCVAVDSGFACMKTCNKFYEKVFQLLKDNPETKHLLSAATTSNFETVVLPLGLRNLSLISSELTSHKENYADERAERDTRMYAAKFYPPNDPKYATFYTRFMPNYITSVKSKYSDASSKKPVSVLSQESYSMLNQTMVNYLLKKKPDGSDNIVRRRKMKPGSEVVSEDGTITYEYYTNEDIAMAELQMMNEKQAHNYLSLDMGYVPFTYDFLLLSTASIMDVKKSSDQEGLVLPSVDGIFLIEEDTDPILAEQYKEVAEIAKRDLMIIEIIESRGAHILSVIKGDYSGLDTNKAFEQSESSSLSMKNIYINLLMYIKFILFIISPLISRIKENGVNPSLTKKDIDKLLGVDINDNGYLKELEDMFSDDDFMMYISENPFMFQIGDHLFRFLMVSLIKRATSGVGIKTGNIITRFSELIGFKKEESSFSNLIDHLLRGISRKVSQKALINVGDLIKIVEDKKEPIVSYAYRTTEKYIDNDGKFTPELELIKSTIAFIDHQKMGKKTTPFRYNVEATNFVFNLDSMIDTIKRLTGYDFITDSILPFKYYKEELNRKITSLNERRTEVYTLLDKIYGDSFPQFYFPPPSIPYDESEKRWAEVKCLELESKISNITSMNPIFDWNEMRETYRKMEKLSDDFANSDIEDPSIVSSIEECKTKYDRLCSECGLDSSFLAKYKTLEKSLFYYSNLDRIRFGFKKFEFKFSKTLSTELRYNLGKTSIIHEGSLRSVQSLLTSSDMTLILGEYFRPMFECFATVNKQAFDISFETVKKPLNKKVPLNESTQFFTDVVMKVTYGSTEDVHNCIKFRTKFFSIKDTDRLLYEAKKQLGVDVNKVDFTMTDVPDNFVITWAKTTEDHISLAGAKGEKTFEFYDKARGCEEMYPYYDNTGPRIIKHEFDRVIERYNQSLTRKIEIEEGNGEKSKNRDNSKGPGLASENGIRESEKAANFWAVKNESGLLVSASNVLKDTISENESKQGKKSIFKERRDNKPRNQHNHKRQDNVSGLLNENEDKAITQVFHQRNRRFIRNEADGWGTVTYGEKRIQGIQRNNADRKYGNQSGGSVSKTPMRFRGGLQDRNQRGSRSRNFRDNRSRSRERESRYSRKGTPSNFSGSRGFSSGNKGTPVSIKSHNTTPNSNRVFSDVSPSTNKRSGVLRGVSSPGAPSPSYLQPEPSIFTNLPISNTMGYYPTHNSLSPIPNDTNKTSLFENLEVPTGVFQISQTTPRETKTPTETSQVFKLDDDDYDF